MTNLYIGIILVLFVAVLVGFWQLQKKHMKFSTRVFIALGSGVLFGAVLQLIFGSSSEVTTGSIEWISIVGTGYVKFLQMLIMALIFVSIVGAFTKIEENP